MTKDLDTQPFEDDIWALKAPSTDLDIIAAYELPEMSPEETRLAQLSKEPKVRKPRSPKGTPKPLKVRVQKESDERYTPDDVLDVVRAVGPIVLDPCSTPDNRTKATHFYTFEDDGLSQDWLETSQGGVIFVNPPFSNLKGWLSKCVEEADRGCNIVALAPGDTSTLWFQGIVWEKAAALCYWKGRIEFIRTSKAFGTAAMQPTAFFFFGSTVDHFEKAFSSHGRILKRVNNKFSLL